MRKAKTPNSAVLLIARIMSDIKVISRANCSRRSLGKR